MGTVKSRATSAVRAPTNFIAAVARGESVMDAARSCYRDNDDDNYNNNGVKNPPSAALAAALASVNNKKNNNNNSNNNNNGSDDDNDENSNNNNGPCCANRCETNLSTVRSLSELLDPERRRKANKCSRRRKGDGKGIRVLIHDNTSGRGFVGVGWDVAPHFAAITAYFDHVIAVTSWQQVADEIRRVTTDTDGQGHRHRLAELQIWVRGAPGKLLLGSAPEEEEEEEEENNNNNNNNNNTATTTTNTSTSTTTNNTSSEGESLVLTADMLSSQSEWAAIRDSFEDNAVLWLRSSKTLQGESGIAFANALSAHFLHKIRVAGHTGEIHTVHRGLVVRPAGASVDAAAWANSAEWCLASDMALVPQQ